MPQRRHVPASLVALLAALTLFALLLVSVLMLEGIRASRPSVAHTRQVQAELSRARGTLADAETGQRGFLLTDDLTYLEPFTTADATMAATLAELKRLTADDPVQFRSVLDLERIALGNLAGLRSTIELYQDGDRAAALDVVRSNDGKVQMDQARRLIADMRAQEDQRLEDRSAALRRNFDRAMWLDAGAGLGLLALGFALFSIHRDIARREVLEKALREETTFQQQFIGILGHDLRNPLMAIAMSASQLRGLSGKESTIVTRIASSAARMSRMIDQLLDLTRARMGDSLPVQPRPGINLSDVVTSVVDELQTAHPEAHLKVELENDVQGNWDPDRISQVISNLVGNAILHGDGIVAVRVRRSNGSATLEVHNGGAPIPVEVLPRIFEPFRRAARDGGTDAHGLGLGLFIAEQIVTAHGGSIEVRSRDGEGTLFAVGLPLTRG